MTLAKVISDGLLIDPNKKNDFIDIYERFAVSDLSYHVPVVKKYVIALFPFYSRIKDLKYDDTNYHVVKAYLLWDMNGLLNN